MDNAVAQERARAKPADVLRYPFEPPKPDGSHVEIVPGLLWLRMPMPMTLDHINVYLLRDGEGWAVVDTGLGIPSTFELWEKIFTEKLAGQPLTRVICTHCHYDHAGAAHWLQERFGVPLLMTYGEFMMLRSLMGPPPDPLPQSHRDFYARSGVTDEELDHMVGAMRKDPFMPKPPSNYQRIRPGEVLQVGDRRWRIVLGEGHSPEHACLYCEEDG
ncbi:MAG: MBL fold metallo-hydrolase, partial [Comamonas sp.]